MSEAAEIAIPAHVRPQQVFEFDIYRDDGLHQDVHTRYSQLQGQVPDAFYTPCNKGHWIVTRYDLISEIVRRPENFSTQQMNIPYNPNPPVFIPLSLDPPRNYPYRQLVASAFMPKAVRQMESELHRFASELIDAVADKGECEFLEDIAGRYPVGVFMRLMGLPMEKQPVFRRIAEEHFRVTCPEEMAASMADIAAELQVFIDARREKPEDDLLSRIVHSEIDGRPMSAQELMSLVQLLFLAGLDTVTNVMTFGARHLAGDPALQQQLRDHPELMDAFAEEVIRMFAVVNTPRLVIEDIDLGGVSFRKGDMVLSILALAGRDDRKNDNPNLFDLSRKTRDHLTFSTGPHLCLGHTLARSEIRVFFAEWLRRIPAFRIKPGASLSTRPGMVMALEALALEWDR